MQSLSADKILAEMDCMDGELKAKVVEFQNIKQVSYLTIPGPL